MEPNILYTHITAAAAFAYVMTHLQQWNKIPWINKDSKRVNTYLRAVMSAFANVGIHWTWAGSWGVGRTLTITIPALAVIGHALFTWLGQYSVQHGFEKVFNIGGRVDPQVLDDVANAVVAKLAAPKS